MVSRMAWQQVIFSSFGAGCLMSSSFHAAIAQITPDAFLGAEQSTIAPTGIIGGGAIRGANLFHSFSNFNVRNGEGIYFANPAGIDRIFSRVTGNTRSTILGTLGVLGTADLFLLNPNGIVFGPNARLDLRGSFVASTSNGVIFDNQFTYGTISPQTPPLLTINLPTGLQYGSSPGGILVQGAVLQVPNGQTLALVGGNVALVGARLLAPASRVEVSGLVTPGVIALNPDALRNSARNSPALLNPSGSTERGTIDLNGTEINVRSDNGGAIVLQGQDVTIRGASRVRAGINSGLGDSNSQAGDIAIYAAGTTTVTGQGIISNAIQPGAIGRAGNVAIETGSLVVTNNSVINSVSFGIGDSGNVSIQASDRVTLSRNSQLTSVILPGATGTGGNVDITTGSLIVQNGGVIAASIQGEGNAGQVNIRVSDLVSFDQGSYAYSNLDSLAEGNGGSIDIITRLFSLTNGAGLIVSTSGLGNGGNVRLQAETVAIDGRDLNTPSAIISQVAPDGVGNAGNIEIVTGSLFLTNGGRLGADTNGIGNSGSITVQARDRVVVDGRAQAGDTSSIGNIVAEGAIGNAGRITIQAGDIAITNDGNVLSSTLSQGNAGNIILDARGSIVLAGQESQVYSTVEAGATGNAGDVVLRGGSLLVAEGANIAVGVAGTGNAGNLLISARDRVTFDGAAAFSSVDKRGVGTGGVIDITTGTLALINGSQLSAQTVGRGNAGNINLRAETILLDGVGTSGSATGFSSGAFSSVAAGAIGQGGTINITANNLTVSNDAIISASTEGNGDAGNIIVTVNRFNAQDAGRLATITTTTGRAGDMTLTVNDQATFVGDRSGLFASTTRTSSGNGGNIRLDAGNLEIRDFARISANSQGIGEGGNISIDTNSLRLSNRASISANTVSNIGGNIQVTVQDILLLRQNSSISTNAGTGRSSLAIGKGGDIAINAGFIVAVPSENSDITANAFLGSGGNISIQTQGIFGIAFRPALTPFSDITASSEFGLAGSVLITTLGIDPVQGTVNLPATFSQPPLAQGCRASSRTGSFKNTGQGGIPANPADPGVADAIWHDLESVENLAQGKPENLAKTASTLPISPTSIIEAQGWVVSPNGTIALTTEAFTGIPQGIGNSAIDCLPN
ncbi:MAG: filamentous hemagglutinin N-terminal domain-containing protein [Oscillatoriales cyanobacterium C42_A2020_001]|nr:filamentous hemagglutinin N-terminal domain-containing protein [Leptolyngbyaceae cyanobacterium C42_A2020_001]